MVPKTNKNIEVVKKFKRKLKKNIQINKLIFFGSRASGTFSENSDFDLLIISDDFKGVQWYKRPIKFYLMWTVKYPVEFLCYTPDEIKKSAKKFGIISEALKEGIEIK